MVVLVTGGSGSGKSEYAENKLLELRSDWINTHVDKKTPESFYVATMFPFDEESKQRVKKHQAMRAEKQFKTVECYTNLKKLPIEMNEGESPGFILLECISNLIANERYQDNGCGMEGQALIAYVVEEVQYCMNRACHMVIVTNEVGSDGVTYDSETLCYQYVLGAVNQTLAQLSEEVWEIVCGIPIRIK